VSTYEQIKKQHAFVWAFGSNKMGELGVSHYNDVIMPERAKGLPKTKIIQISSGGKHSGAITDDGRLYICGSNIHGQLGLEGILTK
jgi:alpha-tubulin suppressor-like RCC1 family protein